MSGLEIVGILLGGTSVVISSLEHLTEGRDAARRWKHNDKACSTLLRHLKAERKILRNVCEALLHRLVNTDQLNVMLDDPTSAWWDDKLVRRKIKRRLDTGFTSFNFLAHEINEGILSLQKRLGTNSNDPVSSSVV